MLLVNIDYIPGRELEPLGLVKGSTIPRTSAATSPSPLRPWWAAN